MATTVTRGLASIMRQQSEPTREALRGLRQHLVNGQDAEPPLYPLSTTRRAAHAVVRLPLGSGQDPNVLATALKRLRKQNDANRVSKLPASRLALFAYASPSEPSPQEVAPRARTHEQNRT